MRRARGGRVMKGGVCSSLYNGVFVPGHGEDAATETALLCQATAAMRYLSGLPSTQFIIQLHTNKLPDIILRL